MSANVYCPPHPTDALSPPRRWNLGKTYRRIIEELADSFLPEGGRDAATRRQVVEFVDDWVPHLPTLFRRTFRLGLLLIQWASMLTTTALRPFTLLPSKARRPYLDRWARSRVPLFRGLLAGLRGLVLAAYYAMPRVYREIGYRPEAHVRACKRRRAALLARVGDVDQHTTSMIFEDIGRSREGG